MQDCKASILASISWIDKCHRITVSAARGTGSLYVGAPGDLVRRPGIHSPVAFVLRFVPAASSAQVIIELREQPIDLGLALLVLITELMRIDLHAFGLRAIAPFHVT